MKFLTKVILLPVFATLLNACTIPENFQGTYINQLTGNEDKPMEMIVEITSNKITFTRRDPYIDRMGDDSIVTFHKELSVQGIVNRKKDILGAIREGKTGVYISPGQVTRLGFGLPDTLQEPFLPRLVIDGSRLLPSTTYDHASIVDVYAVFSMSEPQSVIGMDVERSGEVLIMQIDSKAQKITRFNAYYSDEALLTSLHLGNVGMWSIGEAKMPTATFYRQN